MAWGFCLILLWTGAFATAHADASPALTLLFTTDIHSHAVSHTGFVNGEGQQVGGYARLKSAVDAHWAEGRTLLLDSGDFSMATLYQTFTVSDALDLTLMQAVGYDAVALGNHDFEVTEEGLKDELTLFSRKGGQFPLLCGNLTYPGGAGSAQGDNPLAAYGVQNYAVFERNGLRIGVFSLMGDEASAYTPLTVLSLADPIETAKTIVKQLREVEKVDLVILLSHAGTLPDGSFHEDADIAKAVDGIDVILSGHMHLPMSEPQTVNGAVIVCAGTALDALGKMELFRTGDGWTATCRLIPLTDEWPQDEAILKLIAPYAQKLDSEYFPAYGVSARQDDAVAVSPYNFPDGDAMCLKLDNYALGALIADGYLHTLRSLGLDVQVGMIPVGSVRGGLYHGNVLMKDLYNVLSYGISPLDGSCGSPMVTAYLSGRELFELCETSVSVSAILSSAQLLMGGIRCAYSNLRPLLNKVYQVEVYNPALDAWENVTRSDDKLYLLACSWQSLQSIRLIDSNSYGLLSVSPKDEQGKPLDTLEKQEARIVRLENGAELKEWNTLYQYLNAMETDENGLPVIDARYGVPADYLRKTDPSLQTLFVNPNKVAWYQYGAIAAIVLLIALTVFLVRRRRRKKK